MRSGQVVLWLFAAMVAFFLIRLFFRKSPPPAHAVEHPLLGGLLWSKDDEAWVANYGATRFSLAYDGSSTPTEAVSTYALEVLREPGWLDITLAQAKTDALKTFSAFYSDEIQGLRLGVVHFYIYRGRPRIFADLEGGRDLRSWRIQYDGRQCEGIGFDS